MYQVMLIGDAHPSLFKQLDTTRITCLDAREWSAEQQLAALPKMDGLIMKSSWKIDREFLSKAKKLQVIARLGVGIEHIDEAACVQNGVTVLTSPEGSKDTVAEHTLGLLLTLMNHLARADQQIRNGQWFRADNRGYELKGKTVGIIGYGNMGQAVAQRLHGFGCTVIAYDKHKHDYGDAFAKAVNLDTIYKVSDIVTFHIPYSPENHLLVNADYLRKFEKPIFIVNTARGGILETSALVEALEKQQVLGAALDVLEYEEGSFDQFSFEQLPAPFQYLRNSDRVVLSPHIAGWSFESYEKHSLVIADKLNLFFSEVS